MTYPVNLSVFLTQTQFTEDVNAAAVAIEDDVDEERVVDATNEEKIYIQFQLWQNWRGGTFFELTNRKLKNKIENSKKKET